MATDEHNHTETDALTGDKLLSGHEYDGIRELDNRLPRWWLGLFYITIVIAGIYFFRFHVLKTAPLQAEEYEIEMAKAKDLYNLDERGGQEELALTLMTDEQNLAAGKEVYDKNCAVCHLAQGQGLVGPNLTDDYWIHGCSFEDIVNIIVIGVPEKGMISWKSQLSSTAIQQVSSYIVTMHGTEPPNPKEPQGEKCEM